MMLSVTWGGCVKIALLIAFAAFAKNFARCMHDKFCFLCKKDACCK